MGAFDSTVVIMVRAVVLATDTGVGVVGVGVDGVGVTDDMVMVETGVGVAGAGEGVTLFLLVRVVLVCLAAGVTAADALTSPFSSPVAAEVDHATRRALAVLESMEEEGGCEGVEGVWLSLTFCSELSFASRDPLRSSLLSEAALATTRSFAEGEGGTSSVCLRWSRVFPLLPSLSLSSCPSTIALREKENTELFCFSSLNLLLCRGNLEIRIMRAPCTILEDNAP